jgi:hypothetical protein
MDYEPHDRVLHDTSSHSKQTSDFPIVELVKSLCSSNRRRGMERELSAALLLATGRALCADSAPFDKRKINRDITTSRHLVMLMSDLIALG